MREASKNKNDLADGKTSAQILEPGITVEKLFERLSSWISITPEAMFLYNPEGDLIGEFSV